MKLASLHEVDRLDRRRRMLMSMRDNLNLTAVIRTGSSLGSITEELPHAVIVQLEPIVDADLMRQTADIEASMLRLGVEVD